LLIGKFGAARRMLVFFGLVGLDAVKMTFDETFSFSSVEIA